jgi:hypothetical protein
VFHNHLDWTQAGTDAIYLPSKNEGRKAREKNKGFRTFSEECKVGCGWDYDLG